MRDEEIGLELNWDMCVNPGVNAVHNTRDDK